MSISRLLGSQLVSELFVLARLQVPRRVKSMFLLWFGECRLMSSSGNDLRV